MDNQAEHYKGQFEAWRPDYPLTWFYMVEGDVFGCSSKPVIPLTKAKNLISFATTVKAIAKMVSYD